MSSKKNLSSSRRTRKRQHQEKKSPPSPWRNRMVGHGQPVFDDDSALTEEDLAYFERLTDDSNLIQDLFTSEKIGSLTPTLDKRTAAHKIAVTGCDSDPSSS